MSRIMLLGILLISFGAQAVPKVDCKGTLLIGDSGDIYRTDLKVIGGDPTFSEGFIGDFSFGADTSYLSEDGVGLIVMNTKTEVFASSLMGFRRIGNTKNREARLSLYDKTATGELMVGTVRCGYLEP